MNLELFKLLGTIAVENDSANKAIDETTDKAENASNSMVNAFKSIGAAVATYFAADKIIEFGKEIVNASATVQAEEAEEPQVVVTTNKTDNKYYCPRCHSRLVKRHGPYGDFYGCESYGKTCWRLTRKFR